MYPLHLVRLAHAHFKMHVYFRNSLIAGTTQERADDQRALDHCSLGQPLNRLLGLSTCVLRRRGCRPSHEDSDSIPEYQ